MRPQKFTEAVLLEGMMTVLRSNGYNGASLSDLAKASGLKKSSLYHRFPGGKKQIAQTVLDYVAKSIEKKIDTVLTDTSKTTADRLIEVIDNIREIYQDGNATCILRAMALDKGMDDFSDHINNGVNHWIEGFTSYGKELGQSPEQIKKNARHTLVIIQGSLVVSKMMADNSVFHSALDELKHMYKQP